MLSTGWLEVRMGVVVVLAFMVMVGAARAESVGKEVTRESKERLDIEEVVAFYKDIIVKNPEVAEDYQKLIAAAQEGAIPLSAGE